MDHPFPASFLQMTYFQMHRPNSTSSNDPSKFDKIISTSPRDVFEKPYLTPGLRVNVSVRGHNLKRLYGKMVLF